MRRRALRPQLKRDPLGGGVMRFWCILGFVAMQACSHPRLCDVAPAPAFAILPDTPPAGLVRGVVIALPDSTPLPYAQVHVDSTSVWAMTDAHGRFVLTPVRPGAFILIVRMINYGRCCRVAA
ncbi:MAG: carboxypeptidase-like regulatory domain-containing protein [Methanobacteriota archaeon]|nr:MAG: carboxypeptidase-like regulatory domain-containing protein [Euryarchaeota archaeon]